MKYFLHDSNAFNDEKITELFINYGYEGLGLFYTVLEKLAQQEKPIKTDVLKHQLKVGKKLEKCWCFMENIGLISSNNGETFNKQLLNFSEKYKIKKEKNAERISEWRKRQEDTENVTCYKDVRNTPKVKESKVNRNKDINNNIPEQVGGDNSKVISIGDSEKELYNQALKAFYEYYHNQYSTKYNFTAKDGNQLKLLLKKIEAKCREQELTADNESILNAFQYFISNISDKWILDHFTIPILNSKFNEIFINLKLKSNATIYGIRGNFSEDDKELLRYYFKTAN